MKLLLDTNALLWTIENNPALTKKAKEAIVENTHNIFISIVSLWEVAIKMSIGKLELTYTLDELINKITDHNALLLPIGLEAIRQVKTLPFHHKDPFDRLIIAQAQTQEMAIITNDKAFGKYAVKSIW